jgi:hypothetical protein
MSTADLTIVFLPPLMISLELAVGGITPDVAPVRRIQRIV